VGQHDAQAKPRRKPNPIPAPPGEEFHVNDLWQLSDSMDTFSNVSAAVTGAGVERAGSGVVYVAYEVRDP